MAAQNLQAAKHDGTSLHRDRYRVGTPLGLRSRVLRHCALSVRQGTIRVANKFLQVRVHVQPIRCARFRCQERRRELGSRLWGWSLEVLTDRAREGIRD